MNVFFSKDGTIQRNAVSEAANKLYINLIKLLLNNPQTKNNFFVEVDGVLVFKQVKFGYIINNKEFLSDSYTRYKQNERSFALYSFEGGQRFEPDYVLFLRNNNETSFELLQIFIETKGEHLMKENKWKEDFLLQLTEYANPVIDIHADRYNILGFHFFNSEYEQKEKFRLDIEKKLFDAHSPQSVK